MMKPGMRSTWWLAPGLALASLCLLAAGADETSPAPDAASGEPIVYIIEIFDSPINDITVRRIERALGEADRFGARVVVFEMDTPGGQVGSALDICEQIIAIPQRKVAWVHPNAFSAGAMISLKFPEIVVSENSRLGDCAVIAVGPQGLQPLPETERSKLSAPVLTEFRDSARRNGYPEALCEAMVMLSPAVYELRHKRTDQVEYVFTNKLDKYGLTVDEDGDPDDEANARSDWTIVKEAWPADKLVTLLTEESLEFGFAKAVVDDDAALLEYLELPGAKIIRFEANWSEQLVAWLTSPFVRGLLTIVLLMGLYSEMQSPGLGLPGAVALAAGALLLGAPYLTGLAEMWEILIILLGIALLAVEVFVLPGFGAAGIAGLVLMFAGLLLTFVPDSGGGGIMPNMPQTWAALGEGALTLLISGAVSFVGILILTRYFGAIPVFNRLILAGETRPIAGGTSAGVGTGVETPGLNVGDIGHARSDLRPMGRAEFGSHVHDVTTQGGWIASGARVRVVERTGGRIVVEEVA